MMLARADQARAERLRIAPDRRGHHAAAVEADRAGGLPQLGGDPQDAALPAQVEQLEDVLDVELLERCPRVPRLSPPRPRRCAGDRARSARGSGPATRTGPPGSSCTTRSHACTAWSNCRCRASAAPSVVERPGVLRVEPQHPLERLERLRGAAVLEQRAAQRRERLELVGIGLEQAHQHVDRRARRLGAPQQLGQRQRRGAVGRQQIERPLVGRARRRPVAALLLDPPSSNHTRTSDGRAAARR